MGRTRGYRCDGWLPLQTQIAIEVTLVFAVVHGFTTVFVVPIMILNDCGVLSGWRRLAASIRAEWKQYLAFAVASGVLTFALGVLVSTLLALVALVLLIPLGGLGVLLYATGSLASTVGLLVLGSLVAVFLSVMIVL